MSFPTDKLLATFLVDDHKFVLTKMTLNNHPESLLTKIVNGDATDSSIIFNHQQSLFYVDRDPEAFKYIIDYHRGYDINMNAIENKNLQAKILHDLKYFNLYDINTVVLNLTENNMEDLKFGPDALNEMLESDQDQDQEEREVTPFLKQFIDNLSKIKETKLESGNMENVDHEKITQLLNHLNGGSTSIPLELIHNLSNDETMKQLIKKSQNIKDVLSSESSSMDELVDVEVSEEEEEKEDKKEVNSQSKSKARYIEID